MPPLVIEIVPQIIGVLAVICFVTSYLQKKRKNIILFNSISRFLYVLQYLMLGALSGAVLDIIGAAAVVIAGNKHKPFIKKHLKLIIISMNILMVAVGITICIIKRDPIELLPLGGILLHTGALWLSDEKIIRRISLAGSPFWFSYNLLSKAYGSAVGDVLAITSLIVAMIRYRSRSSKNDIQPAEEYSK